MPADLEAALRNEATMISAWNAQFERLVLNYVLGIPVPIDRMTCSMQHAWSMGFSGTLGQVSAQMGLAPDMRKLATGRKLIDRFCKPAPKNHKASRYDRNSHPVEWDMFRQYCMQDVVAEREIEAILAPYPWPLSERDLWYLDQEINDRGAPVDMRLVHTACKREREAKRCLVQAMDMITGLRNSNSATQLQAWLSHRGVHLPNLQAETVERAIPDMPPGRERRVLELRLAANLASTTKWHAFERCTVDGRVQGMFQFAGAQRTGRWAGRIVQLHNLKRPETEDPDELESWIRDLDAPIDMDVTLDHLSQLIRCAITAPPGKALVVCDLSSIESRILGWMSGCQRINRIFEQGKDTYRDFATEAFGVPYDEVTKEQRTFSKPPVLGCGYQLGGPGLVEYADGMGVSLELHQAEHLVEVWRRLYPEVVRMWYDLLDACKRVVQGELSYYEGYSVRIYRDEWFMFIDLPSGRTLAYAQPAVLDRVPPWGGPPRPTLTYMGMSQHTRKWERLSTHGGKIVENIDQAIARDVLAHGMRNVDSDGYPIVVHVHDELVCEVDERRCEEALWFVQDAMASTPDWAPGLKLEAHGFITKRYRKG